MIVCSCHAVSEEALLRAVGEGLDHAQVVARTGAGTDCGCCAPAVEELVRATGPCRGHAGACPGCPRRVAA